MGDIDVQELEVRLGYWITHNREHGDEFKEWSDKAGEAGMTIVQDNLARAATHMAEATTDLESALQALKSA